MHSGFDMEGAVAVNILVLRAQRGFDRENSVGVLSGGLTMEHRCDKESTIVVQNSSETPKLRPPDKKTQHQLRSVSHESFLAKLSSP